MTAEGYQTLFIPTLTKELNLNSLNNQVFRRIPYSKREALRGKWTEVHNENPHTFFFVTIHYKGDYFEENMREQRLKTHKTLRLPNQGGRMSVE